MSLLKVIMGWVYIIISGIIIVVILLQHSKSANLSGAIAGGAETFFGKNKGRTIDAILAKWTTAIAVLFVVLTVVLNSIQ